MKILWVNARARANSKLLPAPPRRKISLYDKRKIILYDKRLKAQARARAYGQGTAYQTTHAI